MPARHLRPSAHAIALGRPPPLPALRREWVAAALAVVLLAALLAG